MKIVDKRWDYYDGAVEYNEAPIWIRKEESFDLDKSPLDMSTRKYLTELYKKIPDPVVRFSRSIGNVVTTPVVVGFCGRFYILYTSESIIDTTPSKFTKKYNESSEFKIDDNYRWFGVPFTDKSHDDLITNEFNNSIANAICLTLGTPVFSIEYRKRDSPRVTKNPILRSIGFHLIMDPWSTYQEIDRYLGNDMVDVKNVPFDMSDELKRDSKGMDKWSFKQVGPKKRKGKKK